MQESVNASYTVYVKTVYIDFAVGQPRATL